MKSQVITLENVLFFSLGIILVLMVYSTFVSISEDIEKETIKRGVRKIADYVSYEINKVYVAGKKTNSNISLLIFIPPEISKKSYMIREEQGYLYIFVPAYQFKFNLTLYGIDAKLKTRYIPSTKKFILIEYINGKVELK